MNIQNTYIKVEKLISYLKEFNKNEFAKRLEDALTISSIASEIL